jgi:hypothetical protein
MAAETTISEKIINISDKVLGVNSKSYYGEIYISMEILGAG